MGIDSGRRENGSGNKFRRLHRIHRTYRKTTNSQRKFLVQNTKQDPTLTRHRSPALRHHAC